MFTGPVHVMKLPFAASQPHPCPLLPKHRIQGRRLKDGERHAQLSLQLKQQDLSAKGSLIYWGLTFSM